MWITGGLKTHGYGPQRLQLTTSIHKETVFLKFSDSIGYKQNILGSRLLHTDNTYQASARPQVKGSDFYQRDRVAADFEMAHLVHCARKTRRHWQDSIMHCEMWRVSLHYHQQWYRSLVFKKQKVFSYTQAKMKARPRRMHPTGLKQNWEYAGDFFPALKAWAFSAWRIS